MSAQAIDCQGTKIFAGDEVTKPGHRGVVADAQVRASGRNKGKIFVMWVGARGIHSEHSAELTVIGCQP